jgi:hypothetical protein
MDREVLAGVMAVCTELEVAHFYFRREVQPAAAEGDPSDLDGQVPI